MSDAFLAAAPPAALVYHGAPAFAPGRRQGHVTVLRRGVMRCGYGPAFYRQSRRMMAARQVTVNSWADKKAYIAEGSDASAELVYFGGLGDSVQIVDDPAQADVRIRVARDPKGKKTYSAAEARALAARGGPAAPSESKPRGSFFKWAIFGIVVMFGLGIAMVSGGTGAGWALILLSPILGPIAGGIWMGMLSLMGLR